MRDRSATISVRQRGLPRPCTKYAEEPNQDETRQQRWNTEGAEPERSSTGAAADSSDDCGSTGNLGSSKNGEPPLGHQREHGVEGVAAKASLSRATGLSYREEHASASQMPEAARSSASRPTRRHLRCRGRVAAESGTWNSSGRRVRGDVAPPSRRQRRRSSERRIRSWRAINGDEQEVVFRHVHEPGRLGLTSPT